MISLWCIRTESTWDQSYSPARLAACDKETMWVKRSRHVKTPNNSVSLNSSARKPSVLCLTVQKVQLLEILHSPESRLSDEMQTRRSCKRSYEALRVLHREHISRESSVYTRGITVKPFRFQRKAVNYEQTLNSHQLPQRWGTLKFHWLQQTTIANQTVFIGFVFMTWHCCHKSNSCWIYNLSLFSSEELSMRIHY